MEKELKIYAKKQNRKVRECYPIDYLLELDYQEIAEDLETTVEHVKKSIVAQGLNFWSSLFTEIYRDNNFFEYPLGGITARETYKEVVIDRLDLID